MSSDSAELSVPGCYHQKLITHNIRIQVIRTALAVLASARPLPKIPGLFQWLVLARNYSSRQPDVVTLDWEPRQLHNMGMVKWCHLRTQRKALLRVQKLSRLYLQLIILQLFIFVWFGTSCKWAFNKMLHQVSLSPPPHSSVVLNSSVLLLAIFLLL